MIGFQSRRGDTFRCVLYARLRRLDPATGDPLFDPTTHEQLYDPIPLNAGADVWWTLRRTRTDTDANALIRKGAGPNAGALGGIEVAPATYPTNAARVTCTSAEMDLAEGVYYWDAEYLLADGTRSSQHGTLEITHSTRRS